MHIRDLFKKFNVKYVCTTDDPTSDLKYHGIYDGVKILPTFRPDKLFRLSEEYLNELAKSANKEKRIVIKNFCIFITNIIYEQFLFIFLNNLYLFFKISLKKLSHSSTQVVIL